jgi:uncharacterized membrane protein
MSDVVLPPPHRSPSLGTKVKQSFIAGLLVLLPVFVTWKILSFAFTGVDGVLGKPINNLLSHAFPGWDLYLWGVGTLTTLLMVLGIGTFTRYVAFKRIVGWGEAILARIPIARTIYNAVKQVLSQFMGKDTLPFTKVVMIEYPMPGRYMLALLTNEQVDDTRAGADDLVVVFVPSNHLHLGHPVIVPRSHAHPIDMTPEEGIKYLVSAGATLSCPIDLRRTLATDADLEKQRTA